MLLGEPGRTAYDINFPFLGFPIRVHPAFFIMPLIICSSSFQALDAQPGILLVVATAVFFLSILFHELGHSLAFKYYGIHSHIVLYWMGGLAVPSGSGYGSRRPLTSNGQIIVSLAGPFVNFLIGGLLVGIVLALGGDIAFSGGILPFPWPDLTETTLNGNYAAKKFFQLGLFANIGWGVLNLIPVYPLDGGQATRQVFLQFDSHNGLKNSLILSMGVAILIAVIGLQSGDTFLLILFGFMAYSNFQMLQHGGRIGRGW